jgi:hypothetical protein
MNATDIKQAISEHRRELGQLEQRKEVFEVARQEALAAPPSSFNQRDVDEAAAAVARVERQLANTRERIAALKKQLPSEKALREANAEAARLTEEIENARVRHEVSWREFVSVSEQAESSARRTADAYGASRGAVARLTDLARQFGLSVAVPDVAAMPSQYANVVGLTGALISNVAYSGQIDTTVERGLHRAKKALPTES